MVDYYQVLNVPKQAPAGRIKKAYYKLAREWHPDKHQDSQKKEQAEKKFKEISEAYQVLSNEETKMIYDKHGYEGLKQHMQRSDPGDMPDIFSHLFNFGGPGGFGGPMGGGRARSPPKSHQEEVPLSYFHTGHTLSFRLQLQDKCQPCQGTGCKDPQQIKKCATCQGGGQIRQARQIGPGFMAQQVVTCPKCQGQGKTFPEQARCSNCRGKKKTNVPAQVDFYIQPGSDYGSYLIRGKGDYLDGGHRGDIRLDLIPDTNTEKNHYRRKDMKLFYELDITLKEALLGFDRQIPHVDGKTQLRLVSAEVIQPGQVKVLAGQGMPHPRQKNIFGDLYLFFKILFPTQIHTNHRQVLATILPEDSLNTPSKTIKDASLILLDQLKTIQEGDEVTSDGPPVGHPFGGPDGFPPGAGPGPAPGVQCAQQ